MLTMIRNRRRRGFALVLVTLFAVLILSFWAVVYHDLSTLLRVQAAQESRLEPDPNAETLTVVGSALSLLETQGTNPKLDFTCQLSGKLVTFHRDESQVWTVQVADLPADQNPLPMPSVYPDQ